MPKPELIYNHYTSREQPFTMQVKNRTISNQSATNGVTAKEMKTLWAIGDQHEVRDLAVVGKNP